MKLNCKNMIFAAGLVLASSVAAMAQAASGQIPSAGAHDNEGNPIPVLTALSQSAKPGYVVAVLNGKDMTVAELDKWSGLVGISSDMPADQRRLQVLRLLVTMQAFTAAAKAEKLDATPEFKQKMDLMEQSVLQQAYVDKNIMTPVSESELRERYKKESAAIPNETEIHAEHILVKTQKEAEDIIAQLAKGGDFEKIAKEKSLDGTASLGGDLGYFTEGQMVDSFDKAAFALKKGEYTKKPVQTQFGWHIIKILDVRKKQPPTFDDMKMYLQNVIMRERYQNLQRKVLEAYKATYKDPEVTKAMTLSTAQDDDGSDDE